MCCVACLSIRLTEEEISLNSFTYRKTQEKTQNPLIV